MSCAMAPRPLKSVSKQAIAFAMDREALERKPELAKMAMDTIALWSSIEVRLSSVLVELLGAQARPAMAMFSALTSSQAQMAALTAAAQTVLPAEYAQVFESAMVVVRRAAKLRHKFAHWVWGYSDSFPDCLLLVDPSEIVMHKVKFYENFAAKLPEDIVYDPQIEGIWLYEKRDFIEVYVDVVSIQHIVVGLSYLTHKGHLSAEIAHRRLSNEPRIAKQLSRARPRSPTSPEPPP